MNVQLLQVCLHTTKKEGAKYYNRLFASTVLLCEVTSIHFFGSVYIERYGNTIIVPWSGHCTSQNEIEAIVLAIRSLPIFASGKITDCSIV